MNEIQPTTTIIHIPQPGSANDTDLDWLNFFDPAAALKSTVEYIYTLPSSQTPEKHTARVYESGLRYFFAWLTDSPIDTELRHLIALPMPCPTQNKKPRPYGAFKKDR